jgi:hypothetical protein
VISEREAQALWARAAELQERGDEGGVATSPPRLRLGGEREPRSLTQGYRLTEVRDAAVEAGISSRHVERAAAELGLAPAPAPTSEQHPDALTDLATSASAWAGAPLGIGYELQVVGEVPEADFLLLVEIVRQQLGDAGHVATIGRSVSWSSSNQKRRVQVSIIPRGGRTTIRVSERLGPLCGALFGGIIGGGGGGSSGIAFGVGMGVFHSALAACGVLGATLTGTYLLARTIYPAQTRSRREELRTLVERLAMQARDSSRVLPLMP